MSQARTVKKWRVVTHLPDGSHQTRICDSEGEAHRLAHAHRTLHYPETTGIDITEEVWPA